MESGSARSSPGSSAEATAELTGLAAAVCAAADHYDRPAAAAGVDLLEPALRRRSGPGVAIPVLEVLSALRKKRWFGLLAQLTEALLQSGREDPVIVKLYAQSLIDRGLPSAAVAVLESTAPALRPDHPERAEVQGLLGRAFKQMLVASAPAPFAVQRQLADRAVDHYLDVYLEDPTGNGWHGVNAAALLAWRHRHGVPAGGRPAADAIAARVLEAVRGRAMGAGSTVWDLACALEAALALDQPEEALVWTERYLAHSDVDTFELSATLRQLTEIWELTGSDPPGREILPLLRAGVLARSEGGSVAVAPEEVTAAPAGLEKVLGREGMVTYTWYRTGLDRSRAVGQVSDDMGEPCGTGFLVAARQVGLDRLGDELVFLTNAHVIGSDAGALDPGDAMVTFHVLGDAGGRAERQAADLVWSSPPSELDASVLRLEPPVTETDGCPTTDKIPRIDGTQRVYVVGHPQGRALSYSLDDNVLLDADDRVLHYRAPTEPGSSGSPVFNRAWRVIGLHHAGRMDMPRLHAPGTYPANEGIWIEAIRRAVAAATGA